MYKIIIADDERVVLRGIARTIPWEQCGVTLVATAENGKELVEKAREFQPDIILTDIRMPEFDGLEAVRQLKGLLPDCHFLIITAYEEFEYAKKAIEFGVSGYLVKPVMKLELMEQITKLTRKMDGERQKFQNGPAAGEGGTVIARALRYMNSHVDRDISLLEVAEYLHMNSSYFSRYFKEKTGLSFSESVKKMKIERAKELLMTTNLKSYEIAAQIGYQNVQYFSAIFKQYTGLTPREFRNQQER